MEGRQRNLMPQRDYCVIRNATGGNATKRMMPQLALLSFFI
jgi:hypothetical protein